MKNSPAPKIIWTTQYTSKTKKEISLISQSTPNLPKITSILNPFPQPPTYSPKTPCQKKPSSLHLHLSPPPLDSRVYIYPQPLSLTLLEPLFRTYTRGPHTCKCAYIYLPDAMAAAASAVTRGNHNKLGNGQLRSRSSRARARASGAGYQFRAHTLMCRRRRCCRGGINCPSGVRARV